MIGGDVSNYNLEQENLQLNILIIKIFSRIAFVFFRNLNKSHLSLKKYNKVKNYKSSSVFKN